ncbi:MAG: METTL5 family protein [archaeon]
MSMRIPRRIRLELFLQSIQAHPHPKASLEQYTIPADLASEILHIAAFQNDDIVQRDIMDLGTGTGRLALGAAYLGARSVTGVDIDAEALAVAHRKAASSNLRGTTQWILADIEAISGRFDTVLQNPPFGVRKKGADRRFLIKAMETGNVVYSLHKSGPSNREFIKRLVEKHGGTVTGIYQMNFMISRTFQFHRQKRYPVKVDLFRMISHDTKR